MEKGHWRLQPLYWPNQQSGKTAISRWWTGHSSLRAHLKRISIMDFCTLWLQRSRIDGPPHPPGLFSLAATKTPGMAAVHHQQAVGNGGRPAPHHPIPDNMWTEGLSTADRPQKKKNQITSSSEPLIEEIFPLNLTWVLTPFPENSLRWEYKPRFSLCTHAFHCTDSKDPDIQLLDGWMPATKTHPACTIHEDRMWLPLWLD